MTQITIDRSTLEQMLSALNEVDQHVDLKRYDTAPNEVLFDVVMAAMVKGRAALANAEPIARMQPVTKTRVGNYLNKHPMGDLTAYRHGFKDGVKWREQL